MGPPGPTELRGLMETRALMALLGRTGPQGQAEPLERMGLPGPTELPGLMELPASRAR